jgi:hypothetical protein
MDPTADSTEQPPSSVATKASSATGGVLGDGSSSLASGVQSIQLLVEEMLSTLQHSVDTIKKAASISKLVYIHVQANLMARLKFRHVL